MKLFGLVLRIQMNSDPYLQYRHCEGLGDLIACTLHSKIFSPITKIFTGSDKICSSCNKRRYALNYIFPIPVWRIFFKNYDKKTEDLLKYFETEEKKEDVVVIQNQSNDQQHILEEKDLSIPEYSIINESSSEIDDYIFKTIIYKKK